MYTPHTTENKLNYHSYHLIYMHVMIRCRNVNVSRNGNAMPTAWELLCSYFVLIILIIYVENDPDYRFRI